MLLSPSVHATPASILVSGLFEKQYINIASPVYQDPPSPSRFDTLQLAFLLRNDTGTDTFIYLYEGLTEWFHFEAIPDNDSFASVDFVSGRFQYATAGFDYYYFPAHRIAIPKGSGFACRIQYLGTGYRPGTSNVHLLSLAGYQKFLKASRHLENTNFIITYFFVGALGFAFCFFLILYFKSGYGLFFLYSLFLLIQVLYGVIQFDVYTDIGAFMKTRPDWDDYVNEFLVFIGQAVYVIFMAKWMEVKKSSIAIHRVFIGIGIFFLVYAFTFLVLYKINSRAHFLYTMEHGIRMVVIFIQAAVFYLVIFKVRSPVKGYVLAGTFLVLLFGVVFVSLGHAGYFNHTELQYVDYGSWYMIGILCESLLFASGLGLRYYLIQRENFALQQANIEALEQKLTAERDARENENKLAELNQELTNQQLTALRAQMNPHFIFNALNSIQKYVVSGNVDEANSYLSKFSRLQRMILAYSEENFITLDKEIEILRLYLELEQLRLSHEFHFDINVADDIEPDEILIPPMILQPFAENAIWHGLIPKAGEKSLRLSFDLPEEDLLQCTVEDNGIGRKAAQANKEARHEDGTLGKSKGMELVYNRLTLLEKKYNRTFRLSITDKMNDLGLPSGTLVELTIPLVDG